MKKYIAKPDTWFWDEFEIIEGDVV